LLNSISSCFRDIGF